jgi:hypothetical protein
MTVQELIDILKKHDPTQRVIISGYEGGFHDVEGVKFLPIKLDDCSNWYYGPHEQTSYENATEIALIITRIPNPNCAD